MSSSIPPTGAPDTTRSLRLSDGTTSDGGVAPGRVLHGRYRLEVRLASGGMAQVWKGVDDVLRRAVAVKILHPHLVADEVFVARFRQEAVAAARLAHPGIVAIYDTCSDDGIEAIVMELVTGTTLRHLLDGPDAIDPWHAASIVAQVAEALDHAHRAGLVHRDVKPANVLIGLDGRAKVADFGIAKAAADADLTQPGLMVGTAKYLAPEQVTGDEVDGRTDVYSLGVVLYELVCGRPPFTADTDAATALARLHRDPLRPRQVRPGVPRALEDIVCRALARDAADRFPSAADLRAALLAAGAEIDAPPTADPAVLGNGLAEATVAAPLPDGAPKLPPPPPTAPPTFAETERSWIIPTLVVLLVAVALGVAGLLLGRSGAGNLFDGVRDALGASDRGSSPVAIFGVSSFDPFGDGREGDDSVIEAIDGDPDTAWRTERYNDRDITLLKPGVGFVVELDGTHALDSLTVTSPTNGWKAQLHVADGVPRDFDGWGDPVLVSQEIPAGTAELDLGGTRGSAVLIWITDRGDGTGESARVQIQELVVHG